MINNLEIFEKINDDLKQMIKNVWEIKFDIHDSYLGEEITPEIRNTNLNALLECFGGMEYLRYYDINSEYSNKKQRDIVKKHFCIKTKSNTPIYISVDNLYDENEFIIYAIGIYNSIDTDEMILSYMGNEFLGGDRK